MEADWDGRHVAYWHKESRPTAVRRRGVWRPPVMRDTVTRMADERCRKCGEVQPATALSCGACGYSLAAEALRIQRPEDSGDAQFTRLRREEGGEDIALGAVYFGIGALITALTYAFAWGGAGIYVVAYGPMIVGAMRIARGLSKRFG